tara:strand:+ start:32677 stop:32895 length:219 start_codon:yes stop_codon:yes gene_type:complete
MPIFYKFLKLVTKMVDIVIHTMIKSIVVNTKVPLSRKPVGASFGRKTIIGTGKKISGNLTVSYTYLIIIVYV